MPCSMTLQTRSSMPRVDALEAQDLRCVGESAAVELLHAYGGDRALAGGRSAVADHAADVTGLADESAVGACFAPAVGWPEREASI